jgi:hypothetical protein
MASVEDGWYKRAALEAEADHPVEAIHWRASRRFPFVVLSVGCQAAATIGVVHNHVNRPAQSQTASQLLISNL